MPSQQERSRKCMALRRGPVRWQWQRRPWGWALLGKGVAKGVVWVERKTQIWRWEGSEDGQEDEHAIHFFLFLMELVVIGRYIREIVYGVSCYKALSSRSCIQSCSRGSDPEPLGPATQRQYQGRVRPRKDPPLSSPEHRTRWSGETEPEVGLDIRFF